MEKQASLADDEELFGSLITQHKARPARGQADCGIYLGTSKLSDYTKISALGKGTYGEVNKCIHNPTGQIIAMKTFLFEVSKTLQK